jgi:charged multivesicular body protein 1
MCKAAMEKNNMEVARVHAETAIREKNQAVSYLRLGARLTAIHQRVENAIRMKNVTKSMSGIVHSMDEIMSSTLDVVKMSAVMDKFEQQFEDLDIGIKGMENQMQSSMAVSTPEGEVEQLMGQVADEHGLEFEMEMDGMGNVRPKAKVAETAVEDEKKTVTVGAGDKKKGDDDNKGGHSGGDAGASSGAGPSTGTGDDDLEARLRRLQGM